ncbi:MAG: NifU family protein [Nitrospinota bacterium]|jgi:Fe/S biogenesis protein NfuA|nr:NifU family protein [Nitrospinota bacterium]MDP7166610.1 NifU family protein [Nitrospinota bacterium]MDP7370912.1 NifU family protein [Nitrospinota bacterium]MDP7503144.1 NifU family protein [Nitrospinota bacterium]MDP7662330.1 NifU family protein [Nitrospinota bacterium]|tara:strand:+ start:980 stop:1528 length:549 start_codon:yes stop_codon:yes gene_type:complete
MKITEGAVNKINEIMDQQGGGFAGILLSFEGGYKLDLVKEGDEGNYEKLVNGEIGVFAPAEHLSRAEAAQIDFISEGPTSGFKVTRERVGVEESLLQQLQEIIDSEINPAIASHGGVINLLDVEGKRVFVQMGGGCAGCGMADVTLKSGVQERIRQIDPELEVVDTTDHASGDNPYYAPTKK